MAFRESKEKAIWAYPVVHSVRLTELLTHFMADAVQRNSPGGGGPQAIPDDPDQFHQEPYFAELVQLLAKTRAHGTVFRLDSVLWLHLSQLIAQLMHPTDEILDGIRDLCSGVRDEDLSALATLGVSESSSDVRAYQLRKRVLAALSVRNEFANRTVSRMVGDEQANVLQSAMSANQLVYTLPTGFLDVLDVRTLGAARDQGVNSTYLGDLLTTLRSVVEDLYVHRNDRGLSGTESFFVSQFFGKERLRSIRKMSVERFPIGTRRKSKNDDEVFRFKVGWALALNDEVLRYLVSHVDQLNVRRALTGKLGKLSKRLRSDLESGTGLREHEGRILDVARRLRVLDLFEAAREHLVQVTEDRGVYSLDGQELQSSTVPLDLDSFYEVFRRNRSGTAAFIDLIGFTSKTRELFFGENKRAAMREVDEQDRGELASFALERLFDVRKELAGFDGKPEGFEGDAFLDIFPDPLDALRYIARFRENFWENVEVQFRPFAHPVSNPFTVEGFRVGIATGEYTLVNVPDVDAAGESHVRLRAIGPTINKASRLNTGKKGAFELNLAPESDSVGDSDEDPLGIFQVHVSGEMLNNIGICIDRNTYEGIFDLVRSKRLPHRVAREARPFRINGRRGVPIHYEFDLLFNDPQTQMIFAFSKLSQAPKLKGLRRSESIVYEVLPFTEQEYLEFLDNDAELGDAAVSAEYEGRLGDSLGSLSGDDGDSMEDLIEELPDYLFDGMRPITTELPVHPAVGDDAADSIEEALRSKGDVSLEGERASGPGEEAAGESLLSGWGEPESTMGARSPDPGHTEDSVASSASSVSALGGSRFEDSEGSSQEPSSSHDGMSFGSEMDGYSTDFLSRFSDTLPGTKDGPAISATESLGTKLEAGSVADAMYVDPEEMSEPSAIQQEQSEESSIGWQGESEVEILASNDPLSDLVEEPSFDPQDEMSEDALDAAVAKAMDEFEMDDEPAEDDLPEFLSDTTGEGPMPSLGLEDQDVPDFLQVSGEMTGPDPEMPEPEYAPSLGGLPEEEASTEAPSLLGVVGDDLADRIAEVMGYHKSPPSSLRRGGQMGTGGFAAVDSGGPPQSARDNKELIRVPVPELDDLIADYHIVHVGSGGAHWEFWIGRLAMDKLFDLHRYKLPLGGSLAEASDKALDRFLRDKVREDFLPLGSRYSPLPGGGSEPVPVSRRTAARILREIL